MIKFLDLKAVNQRYESDIRDAFDRILGSGWYLLGKELDGFENDFSTYCQSKHALGVASGLDALILVMKAYGFGPGDEILVPSNTYVASVLAISACNASPVFVEPDPLTYLIDIEDAEKKVTDKTKGIVPVHLYGRCCDMEPIISLAKKHRLKIVDDAAQGHGSVRDVGACDFAGRSMAFSFYPSKNLGALADGGAVVTNDDELAEKIKALRNYGSHERYYNKYIGMNSRMDELQASILSIKLRGLDEDNAMRRKIAKCYLETIENDDVMLPGSPDKPEDHSWHLFAIRTKHRDRLRQYLEENGIETQIHYPVPPHKQQCYVECNVLSLPIAEQLADEVLSLPISPVMTEEDAQRVAEVINEWS